MSATPISVVQVKRCNPGGGLHLPQEPAVRVVCVHLVTQEIVCSCGTCGSCRWSVYSCGTAVRACSRGFAAGCCRSIRTPWHGVTARRPCGISGTGGSTHVVNIPRAAGELRADAADGAWALSSCVFSCFSNSVHVLKVRCIAGGV